MGFLRVHLILCSISNITKSGMNITPFFSSECMVVRGRLGVELSKQYYTFVTWKM